MAGNYHKYFIKDNICYSLNAKNIFFSILSKVTYDIINGNDKLCLIPLKSLLKVLYKLEIISYKDINNIFANEQFVNGSTKHKFWVNIMIILH